MARDWYLLKSPYNQISGFEDEAISDFAEEGFAEVLNSEIGSNVELCNYDLSKCIPIRVIVQNNLANTKSNTLTRQFLALVGTCKAGMYIRYKDRYWLIVGLVDNNLMYEKAVAVLCNYKLSWVNAAGHIVQRWINASSASQYNNGETSTKHYFVQTDQLMILTPDDEECLLIDRGQRLIIDRRCEVYERKFGDDVVEDTSNPVTVYRVTRVDSVIFDYQDSGHSEFMAYQDEQHENDGYYVVDGQGYWLCDKPCTKKDEISLLSCYIESESDNMYAQLDAAVFTARFYDANGNEIEVEPKWSIESDIADRLQIKYVDQSILISTDDPACINKSFILTLSAESYTPFEKQITIKAFL